MRNPTPILFFVLLLACDGGTTEPEQAHCTTIQVISTSI